MRTVEEFLQTAELVCDSAAELAGVSHGVESIAELGTRKRTR